MRDVMADVDRWREEGESVAIATVISTWGSAPRGIGSKMALTGGGKMAGSVSGGCVEGAVFEAGSDTLKTGQPQLLHFGVADETAWEVGLACGGKIDVFVSKLDSEQYEQVRADVEDDRAFAMATVVRGPEESIGRSAVLKEDGTYFGSLGDGLHDAVDTTVRDALAEGKSRSFKPSLEGANGSDQEEALEVFIDVHMPSPRLIIVGAVHIAIALTHISRALGYQTIVVDPRRAFGSEERFPQAKFIVGGPITWSFEQEGKLDLLDVFDFIFILDGEKTLPEFLRALEEGQLPEEKTIRAQRL